MAELLLVPLKKTVDVDLSKPLKNLIQATYSTSDNTEDYSDAVNELNRLRSNAVWKATEKSSLDAIYSYYDQLVSLENKIPAHEVQIPFKWKDAFERRGLLGSRTAATVSSLAYERVCVLFNIAAHQSGVAAMEPLDGEEALKNAAKLLQQAAGVFSYLKTNVTAILHQDTTPDLTPDALSALCALMLAQAQDVIAAKCIRDEMKESMVAKVCAQCEELYAEAARALNKEPVKNMWDRDWLATIAAKQAAFRGLSQYYQALACKAAGAVGEEIARLQVAVEQIKQAQSRLLAWNALNEFAAKAAKNLNIAQRDNDFIYHERIPDMLDPIARAPIAKALPLPTRWTHHPDLFEKLVPIAVHAALQTSAARRSEMVNAEVTRLRDATQLLNSILASLSLPACLESGDALPDAIKSRADSVRSAGGLPELRRLAAELPELLQRNRDILEEAKRMLKEEQETDSRLRSQYGAKWTRTDSNTLTTGLRANADKYSQIIDNAVRADEIVKQKLEQHKDNIALLGGSEEALTAGVPRAPLASGAAAAPAAAALRPLMRQVDALKADRDSLESELRDVTIDLKERFLSALSADGALDEPALSAAALGHALAPLKQRADESIKKQEELLAEIQAAHSELMAQRGGASGRDAALAALCAASDAYSELHANLNEGVKFYNDLTHLLVAFQNKVSDFCFARRTEKDELLKELASDAARSAPPVVTPPQHHTPQEPPVVASQAPPALPYPQQPQGMPLPYGAGMPYYVPPPMPAMYNPYATLPYPHHQRPQPPYQPYQYPPPQQQNPYNPYGPQ